MPTYVVELVRRSLAALDGAIVLVLGLTYKADVTDTRESPAKHVIELLGAAGAVVRDTADESLVPADLARRMRRLIAVDTRGKLDRPAWVSAGFHIALLGQG